METMSEEVMWLSQITYGVLDWLATLFVFFLGLMALVVVVLFFIDVTQKKDAVRRNYPVIGRFRHMFSQLGEFFRQYFFAMDREEMPFNRAERDWVYRSSAGGDNTVAFGSTRNLTPPGTAIFANAPFPALDEEIHEVDEGVLIGPHCEKPYLAKSLINISGMSFGAISKPAVKALSQGAKLANCWMNTGEGGLSKYHLSGGCDIVFQIGTAKYGVRNPEGGLSEKKLREVAAHPEVKMFELKLAQGAKPGKGGLLPGAKITKRIADIRGIEPGHDSVSPNRHPEVGNNQQLIDFVDHIRTLTGKPVGFKTVVGDTEWLSTLCEDIVVRGVEHAPDFITIDSGDGGTGAAPMPLMDNVGLTIREALPRVIDTLEKHGLRDRIKVIASGKLITPAEVAWAYCVGADFVTSARGFMFSLGCIQALKCNKNTCPTGITTHDMRLQRGLVPEEKATKVKNFAAKIHYGVGLIAHSCGVSHPRQLERRHCRIVQSGTESIRLDKLYPPVED